MGEAKLSLSPISKADSEHRALFSQDAQDERQRDRRSQRNLHGGTRRFLVFAVEVSSAEPEGEHRQDKEATVGEKGPIPAA